MKKQMKILQLSGIALMLSFASSVAIAGNVASEHIDTGGVSLSPIDSYDEATLRVSGDNHDDSQSYTSSENIRIDAGNFADGTYHYELHVSINPAEGDPESGYSDTQSGSFVIEAGNAYSPEKAEELAQIEAEQAEALAAANTPAAPSAE